MAPSVPGGTTQFGDHTPMRPKLLIASPGSTATTDVKETPRSAAAAIPVAVVECFKPSTSGNIRDHGLGCALAGHFLRHQPDAVERALHAGLSRLVILGVFVDVPHVVEALAGEDVARGEHRRHHRVGLVVV